MESPQKSIKNGLSNYYTAKIETLEQKIRDKKLNLTRLEAQRNELNSAGKILISQIPQGGTHFTISRRKPHRRSRQANGKG